MAIHNDIGRLGEDLVGKWLKEKGYQIITQNYRKRFGEIDLVTRETSGRVHFIEVKSVSYETRTALEYAVSHETWRPEEKVHKEKQKRFRNIIQSWLIENPYVSDFQIDIVTVRMVPREKYARVGLIENIILDG
jgi:putative endonuclease